MKNFIEEMRWRGMLQDVTAGVEEHLMEGMKVAYVGIDPTADSLHIGHLVSVMMLKHLQMCGHMPLALIGGATGMIGDPSGKSSERNLLDEETIKKNQDALEKQLMRLLEITDKDGNMLGDGKPWAETSDAPNMAQVCNNLDWMKRISFIDFIRDIGKHIPVSYMMSKESVKKRISGEDSEGMSFTEFTYQLVQAYDFFMLNDERCGCTVQIGGSDQWGNITTGIELIRRKRGQKAFAVTCPLLTKADGTKFGKSESGNIWLDPEKTSPFKFYQFWLNVSDGDAERFIKIFTLLSKRDIDRLTLEHNENRSLRILQRKLAEEVTVMVHSRKDFDLALNATEALFNDSSVEGLRSLKTMTLVEIFLNLQNGMVSDEEISEGINIVELLSTKMGFFKSNSEVRRAVKEGSLFLNREKIVDDKFVVTKKNLIKGFILLQRGKKNHFMVCVK